jgi:hypothetical protein
LYRKKTLSRHGGTNDHLSFNDIKDRTYAGARVSKMFKYLVFRAGLETDGNNLFELAKNTRTSVLMLEKFYLTHLPPQMPEFTRQLRPSGFWRRGNMYFGTRSR